jgi:hypothetical protein
MKQPLDKPIAAIFATCHEYYVTNAGDSARERDGTVYKEVQTALTKTLGAMAALHSAQYPEWTVDKNHAGYLIKLEPPMLLRVPYHVLPTFPTGNDLQTLWDLSRAIRSGVQSVISLSGSNVLRKMFDVVGDIDFCEYFRTDDPAGFSKIASNMDGDDRIICLRVALLGKQWGAAVDEWEYPWNNTRPTEKVFSELIDSSDADRSTMKVDYVGHVDSFGVTEITNLIIALDKNWHSAGLMKTFAAQEAPLVPIDWLPNHMDDPIEMGRYIHFLVNAIVSLSNKRDMRKCLKRCASLSRILFVPTITNAIVKLVNSSGMFLSHKIAELERISDRLDRLGDDRSKRVSKLIRDQSAELTTELAKFPDMPDPTQFDDGANQIVEELLQYVRPDLSSRRVA